MARNDTKEKGYLINEVSHRVGLSQKRLREYEKEGLIKPAREPNTNNRLYTEKDIAAILRIKDLIHEHGFTLSSIQYIVANMACWRVFDCPEKAICPVYTSQLTPCYQIKVASRGKGDQMDCTDCPIFLNRHLPKMAILEKF